MKRTFALLAVYLLALALPCFGETAVDIFSPIPAGIKYKETMRRDVWESVNMRQRRSGVDQLGLNGETRQSSFFQVPKSGARMALTTYKVVEDYRIGKPPVARDWDKDFLIPLPDDFNTLNRNLLRIRPSFILDGGWNVTAPKIKITDGKPDFRILLRKDGNFF